MTRRGLVVLSLVCGLTSALGTGSALGWNCPVQIKAAEDAAMVDVISNGRLILGVAIGGVVSVIASQLVAGMLFGVEPWDAVSFVTIAGVLALTAIVAAAAPAIQ